VCPAAHLPDWVGWAIFVGPPAVLGLTALVAAFLVLVGVQAKRIFGPTRSALIAVAILTIIAGSSVLGMAYGVGKGAALLALAGNPVRLHLVVELAPLVAEPVEVLNIADGRP